MMNNGTQAHGDDAENVWTQPRFVTAAIVVGLIVVLGIVLAVTGGKGDSTAASPSAPNPPASSAPAASRDCDLPAGSQSVPVDTPQGTRWELVGKMIAPTAPKTYGPAVVKDGFRTCFAHSPMGALYATASFWATATAKAPPDIYERLAADSKARDKAIAASQGQGPGLGTSASLQIVGFSFGSYERSRADVRLALRAGNGRLVQIDSTMLWTGGDWRYQIPLDQRPAVSALTDLNDFVRWTGT